MKTLQVKIRGIAPMLMHNGQLADPLNYYSKKLKLISSKRKKEDSDHYDMAHIEFMGSFWLNKDGQVIVPAYVLEACILSGAAKDKNKTAFKSTIMVSDPDPVLVYNGPKSVDDMWEDESFHFVSLVGVNGNKVRRTRPIFNDWSLSFDVIFDDNNVNEDALKQAIEKAGRFNGIGDYRPKFGRFEVESFKIV